jgi:hypothetical protein
MKSIRLFPIATLAVLLSTGCDKPAPSASSETAKQLAEMERKAEEAVARQQELEQQLEDQKLAAERDAIERERMELDEARAALELQQSQSAEADAEKIRLREEALAAREEILEAQRAASEDKEIQLRERDLQLSASERELAGSQALNRDEPAVDPTPVGDYGTFYDSLSSYGSWFETPNYGYVWQPGVVRDSAWRPYTRGRWVCSDYGWTWVSDEPFGWATYHYGRWALVSGIGWVWVPGSEWAPSWVSWRTSGSHIGWAPLPPETLAYRRHHWDSSVDVTFSIGASWFNFVETRNFDRPIHRHCLPYRQNHTFYHQTNNITNIYVQNNNIISGGPRYADLSSRIGRPLPFYRLDMDHRSRPGRDSLSMQPRIDGSRLRIAAPAIDVPWNDDLKPKRVKKRLDSINVERAETLRPEITEQFRRSREENQRKAEQSVESLGGRETFERRRIEQLEANRLKLDQQKRKTQEVKESRDTRMTRDTRPQDSPKDRVDHRRQADDLATRPTRDEQNRKRPDSTPNPAVTPSVPPLPREQPESVKLRQPSTPTETPQQADQPDLQPKTEEIKHPREQSRQKQLDEAQLEQARQKLRGTTRQKPLDEARQKHPQPDKEIPPQPSRRQPNESPRSTDPIDPQPTAENTQRQREQATREAQQQETQREQARKSQIDNARREQAEQQQQNAQRRREQAAREAQQQETQREQGHKSQIDNARREQAEQQQQNAQRRREQATREAQQQEAQREQARKSQIDNARREQAEQQQQQDSQREQYRQKQRDEPQRESIRKPPGSPRQEDENIDPSRFRRR